ncbi:MAG TPA: hypothetical protein VFF73_07105 [Planctomycetota bacterium]|nr:hypothetical protein [Planctomycetota bacterium]
MNFEVQNALTAMDGKTEPFLIEEAFRHGDLTARKRASEALKDLDQKLATARLRSVLSLY